MQFLEKNKEGIRDLRTKTRQAFPVRAKVPPERIISFVNQEAKGLLTKFYETIEKKVLRKIRVEGGYAQYMTDMFGSCLAEGDPWAVCYFKLTYFPLTRIIFPEQKAELGDAFPELFILVDAKKTTRLLFDKLDTSVAKLQREDLFMAGVGFRNHVIENFDQSAEVLKQLRSSFEPMISSYLTINDRVFVVVASRIEAVDGQYLGALLVGHELGKGLAWQDTAVTLGIRPVLEQCIEDTKAEADAANLTSDKLCEYEMSLQEKGVTYLYKNRKGQFIRAGSSLSESAANSLSQVAKNMVNHPHFMSDQILAQAIQLPVDLVPEGEILQAILSIDIDSAVSMFTTMKVILLVSGIIVFILGMLVIQILVRSFNRPFEEIDAGIHEIIGGNFDYQFPFAFREELPRSMAQSLSIMKAVLLGLPLPEDQERDDSWAENLRVEGGGAERPAPTRPAPAAGPAASTPAAAAMEEELSEEHHVVHSEEIEEIKAGEVKETATEYYRRLFKEYVAAKQGIGEDVSKITYIKFVEKIAKTEKSLREKYDCKQLHFRVHKKDNQVVLVPLKVID